MGRGIFTVFAILEVAAVIGGALGRDRPKLEGDLLIGIHYLYRVFLDFVLLLFFCVGNASFIFFALELHLLARRELTYGQFSTSHALHG